MTLREIQEGVTQRGAHIERQTMTDIWKVALKDRREGQTDRGRHGKSDKHIGRKEGNP